MNIHSYQVRISGDRAEFSNVDFESHPITVWFENKEYIVFKIPSGKHWKSILEPSVSHPGQYLVTSIEEEEHPSYAVEGIRYLRVRELFSMPLSNRGGESGG